MRLMCANFQLCVYAAARCMWYRSVMELATAHDCVSSSMQSEGNK